MHFAVLHLTYPSVEWEGRGEKNKDAVNLKLTERKIVRCIEEVFSSCKNRKKEKGKPTAEAGF